MQVNEYIQKQILGLIEFKENVLKALFGDVPLNKIPDLCPTLVRKRDDFNIEQVWINGSFIGTFHYNQLKTNLKTGEINFHHTFTMDSEAPILYQERFIKYVNSQSKESDTRI